jgi:TonB family protein
MIHLINRIAEAWFPYMASATLQATILALVVLGILWIGRRWSPALRYAFMMLALCKFVIPPMLSLPTGLLNRIQPQRWAESALPLRYVVFVAQIVLSPVSNAQPTGMQALPLGSHPQPSLTTNGRLLLLHLSGALLILAVAALQKIRLGRLASRATTAQAPALADTYDALCRSMKLIRKPRLVISSDNQAPITFGARKPVVMLPQALVAALPLPEIRVILGHELAHNRRRDPWMAWLQVMISAVWWFNPVYWLLSHSIRGVREDCCDDMVLASGLASREVYCRTLLKAARAALENKAVTRTSFAYLGKSLPLRRRLKRIMSARFIRAPKLALAGILMIIALALVLLPGVEPRILAQNEIRSAAHAWSLNPAPQETAAVFDEDSKAESRSPDENRNKWYEPLSGSNQARAELPETFQSPNVPNSDAQVTPKQFSVTLDSTAIPQEEQSNTPYVVGSAGVKPPVVLTQSLPAYTEEARAFRIEGIVLVQAVIRKDGSVDSFKLVRELGYGLDESAIKTIGTRWRFEPGTLDGEPVDVQANIEVSFKLFKGPEDRGTLNEYPLRVRIIKTEWKQESSGNRIGSGYANLWTGGSPRGFIYTQLCNSVFRQGGDYPAKWNEPESSLEIVTAYDQPMGGVQVCEFKVAMQNSIFTLQDGKPVAADPPSIRK